MSNTPEPDESGTQIDSQNNDGPDATSAADNDNLAHTTMEKMVNIYESGARWDMDLPLMSLGHLLDESVVKFHDRIAMSFKGKNITYREFGILVSHAAKGLQEQGVKPGKRVGLFMPNSPYYPIMFFAAQKLGATVVNYASDATQESLESQINSSETDLMVTMDLNGFYDKVQIAQDKCDLDKVVVASLAGMLPFGVDVIMECLDAIKKWTGHEYKLANVEYTDSCMSFDDLMDNDGLYNSVNIQPEEAVAVFQYTTGTTKAPKGAMLTHFNLVANALQIQEMFLRDRAEKNGELIDPNRGGSVLSAIPFFHVFGMMVGMIGALRMGGEMSILPNPRDLPDIMKTIQKRKPAIFPAVPLLLQKIAAHPQLKKYDLSSLLYVISGGSALPPDVKRSFEDALGKEDVIFEGYGLSETSPVVSSNAPATDNRSGSVGRPYPRTEVRISDLNDHEKTLQIGEKGLIWVKGPQVMQGYHNMPEETAEVLTEDGWFLTGDIGFLDEDYYLHLTGRQKRLIIVNGHNVNPEQVENVMMDHPDVEQVCVICVPYKTGETGKAIVRFREGAETNMDDLKEWLNDKVDHFEMPKFFEERTTPLPEIGIGKPDFRKLEAEDKKKRDGEGYASNTSRRIYSSQGNGNTRMSSMMERTLSRRFAGQATSIFTEDLSDRTEPVTKPASDDQAGRIPSNTNELPQHKAFEPHRLQGV
jgi:long-chain acyl-CoA synthetase